MNGKIRAYAIHSTELINELQRRHHTWPTASAALGRAATAGAMIGAMLKGNEKLTIQIKGNGPIGQILIDANGMGQVRGYVSNPKVHLPLNEQGKLDVAGAVGEGTIYVIKDLGLKESYRGSTPIISGELGEDFTYYFTHSEQTPSAVALGVLVNPDHSIQAAGGFIIQILPGISDQEIKDLEKTIEEIQSVSALINQGLTPEEILTKIFKNDLKILDKMDIQFKCNCSKERIESVLIQLGKEEIEDMIEKEGEAEIICQFCNTKYHFDQTELRELLLKL